MKHPSAAICMAISLSFGLAPRADASALFLDGVDDWVSFLGTDVPTGASPFTISAWINPTSVPGNTGQITFWGNQTGNQANGFRLRTDSGTRHYFWANDHDENFGQSILSDTTGPNADGWHHLAVTYDGTTTNQYWNGASLGSSRNAGAVNVAAANYRIGSRLGAEFFHGFIDELSIWNTALDAAAIASSFDAPLTASPSLVAYWDFENGLVDQAGGNNNGTAMGGARVEAGVNAPVASVPVPVPSTLALLAGVLGWRSFRRNR